MPWAEQGDVCAVLLVGLKPSKTGYWGQRTRVCYPLGEVLSPSRRGDSCSVTRVPTWVEQPEGAVPRAACGDSNLHINKYLIWF